VHHPSAPLQQSEMGAWITRCCCEPEQGEQIDGDRSPLVNDNNDDAYMPSVQVNDVADNEVSLPEGGDSTFIGSATSTVGSLQGQFRSTMEQRQKEEERALQNILDVMSKQFVDMEGYQAHHTNAMAAMAAAAEPPFVQERAKEYGKRLQKAAHAIYLKHSSSEEQQLQQQQPVMADLHKSELEKVLYGQVISDTDAMLISEVSARAQEALIDFKIELLDEVMVPLDTSAVQQGGSCNDPVCLAPTHRGDADNDR